MRLEMDKDEFAVEDLLKRYIKNILEHKQNDFFENEFNFQKKLYKELKNSLKDKYPLNKIYVNVEYNCLNFYFEKDIEINKISDGNHKFHYENKKAGERIGSNVIDVVILIDGKYYLIGLKLSEYDRNRKYIGGTNIERVSDGYKDDIELFTKLINEFDNIKYGYCILLCTENIEAVSLCSIKETLGIPVFPERDENTGYSYFIKNC
jgi:hypothetical protein